MRFRTVRLPLFTGFVIYTAGLIGLATIQPGDGLSSLIFAGLAGIGFGAPLVLILTAVQLSTPHHLIATATAVTTSARAVGATVFTVIYAAALNARLEVKLPAYIGSAAVKAGLASDNVAAFIGALLAQDTAALSAIAGANSTIIDAALAAMKQAFADSLRVVYFIAVPFGVVACVACYFLGDLRKTMNYRVDAPVENLTARRHSSER